MAFWEKLALAALRGAVKEGEKEIEKAFRKLEKDESNPKDVVFDAEVIETKKKV